MLTESFVAATLAASSKSNIPSALKDIGIVLHDFQPRNVIKHGFKKSSAQVNCVAVSSTHIFASQAAKAVVHVYSRAKGTQDSTVAFPERIHSIVFAGESGGFLALGTDGGRLIVWDVASGRQAMSTCPHLQPISHLAVSPSHDSILSGSSDSNVHVWSLSNLISFAQPRSLSSNDPAANAPLRTFLNHRSSISALGCGHSKLLANFAVSASSDNTCYVWNVGDCQILRTVLFPSSPLCFALDPADRAVYSGHANGSIQCFDFHRDPQGHHVVASPAPLHAQELQAEKSWPPASADIGSAQCLTLSYDGTFLISGHSSGKIVSWDVAKRRVQKVIADLAFPVTNLAMQPPEGLPHSRPPTEVTMIKKPRIEDSSSLHLTGTSGIPIDYSLRVQITPQPPSSQSITLSHLPTETDFSTLLACPTFPRSLIDEAVLDLTLSPTQPSDRNAPFHDVPYSEEDPSTHTAVQVDKFQSRISTLEETLSAYKTATERSRARRLARMKRRDELGQKKREAYFEAIGKSSRNGGTDMDFEADGLAAMKSWERKEEELDRESDDVECGEAVYGDV